MGNWRTVNIRGHMNVDEAKDAIKLLGKDKVKVWELYESIEQNFDCLLFSDSLCGLNQWIKEDGTIDAIGNLYERDFDNDDIEMALNFLAKRYPSIELTLNSGSDWENLVCSATFHVKNGVVERCAPEVNEIHGIPREVVKERLFRFIQGG